MNKNSRYSKVSVTLIGIILFSSILMGLISEDIKEQNDMESTKETPIIPKATGTRSPAQTTRSVLVELVTGTWCPPCQGGEGALDTLANEYPLTELSILEYHAYNGDPYEVPGNQERASYYGITNVPTAVFDGIDMVVGGSTNPDDPGVYNTYKTKIEARLPVASPVTVTMTGSLTGGTGSITANITAIDDIPPGLTNLKARFVVYEDHNYTVYVGSPSREYRLRYTVVEHLTEESISLSMYDNLQFTKTFSIDPSWDTELLGAVVFVQADSTKEILQATSFNLSAASSKVDLAVTPHDISFSDPNPFENQMVTIQARIHNRGTLTTPSDVYVRFYDGDPSAGGSLIGTEQNAGIILSGGSATAQVTWSTIGKAGDHEIVVVADYSDTIWEPENENNNIAPRFINVIAGPPPEIDYVQIRTAPSGGGTNLCDPANYPDYPVGHVTAFYAAGYNASLGYVFDVDSLWITSDDFIVDVTAGGPSSTVTCSNVNDGTATITVIDNTWGNMNTTEVTVLTPTVDFLQIRDAPGGGGNMVTSRTYSASDTDSFYAAGYNVTAGYLNDVAADWSSDDTGVGDVSPLTGTSTTFTAQSVGLDSTCTVTADFGGISDSTGLLTVLGPVIDYILIMDAPGGVGSEVTTATYAVWVADNFYAAAFNDTVAYVGDVVADWVSDAPLVGGVTPANGITTSFIAQEVASDSTCTVTATYDTLSDSTGLLTVLAPTIDEIKILDASGGGGIEVTTATFVIWQTDDFYAAAYNDTVDYLSDVPADWDSDDTLVGDVSPTTGSTTTQFTAQDVAADGTCTITATYGILSDTTDLLTVLASTIDQIKIMDAPGGIGNVVTTATYAVMDTDDFYAAAFNDTSDYLSDVDADWSSNAPLTGDVMPKTASPTTTFSAKEIASDSTCIVTATYGIISDTTGLLTVLAPRIDEIIIRDAANNAGNEVTTATYAVYDSDYFYAAAYNDTVDYLYDVNAVWSSDNAAVGQVDDIVPPATFTAQMVSADDTCVVTADFNGITDDTGTLTVLAPTVDYIEIRDGPEGSGSVVDTMTYGAEDTDEFYAAAYNDTIGFISDVDVTWSSSAETVGTVTTSGIYTSFEAQETLTESTCTVTADYGGITHSTGLITVLNPRIDYIKVMDAANGLGSEVTDRTYMITGTDEFYAASYNNTVGYLFDVSCDWSSDASSIGDVSPITGTTTTFTAQDVGVDGTCTISATYGSVSDSTDLLTVLVVTIDEIKIRDSPGGLGNIVTTATYNVFETGDFYTAAYNDTAGYLGDVTAAWSIDISSVGNVSQTIGIMTTFTAQHVLLDSSCTVTAKYGIIIDSTGLLTVLAPKPDEIMIRDSADGAGNVVTVATYQVWETDSFYAAAYNETVGYLFDVSVTWSSDDPSVGSVAPVDGATITLTAQQVTADSTITVTASYNGITNSTGPHLVLAPTVDEIKIRDLPDGEGNEILDLTFDAGNVATFYAAAYNDTTGYLFDISVEWTCDLDSVGEVTPQGTSTTFTAQSLEETGTCTVSVTYSGLSSSTGLLTINALVDITGPQTPAQPNLEVLEEDRLEFSWPMNTDSDIDHYIVQRATKPDGPWDDLAEVDSDKSSYKDKNLDSGTTYYYRVVAYDEAGNPSEPSEPMKVKIKETGSFFDEFLWLFLIIIILVVVVIAVALIARGRKKEPQPQKNAGNIEKAPVAAAAPQRTSLPPPPRRRPPKKAQSDSQKPKGATGAKQAKPLPPPPKSSSQKKVTQEKEMPPPPPPES